MKKQLLMLGVMTASAGLAICPSAAQTDIVRKPSNWRGTLLEGTDALISTDDHGYPLFIQSGQTVGAMFRPAPMSGETLAAEFKSLCLDTGFDQARLASAAAASTLGLSSQTLEIPDLREGPSYRASLWVSPAARVQIWSGETAALNRRQTLSRWRNGATQSVFRPSAAAPLSCGLTVMSTGFRSPGGFIAAMQAALGAEPAKAVAKPQWADGHWKIAAAGGGETRIVYSMTDLDRAEQLLHVAVVREED